MQKIYAVVFFSLLKLFAIAQVTSSYNFSFLKSSPSARLTGLNGSAIAYAGKDVSTAAFNPSLLTADNDKQINFQSQFVPGGISNNYLGYAFAAKKLNVVFYPQLQYLSYGTFTRADVFGNKQGEFSAREWVLSLTAAKQINERLSIGATGKFLNSQFDVISARAVAFDVAGAYHNPESNFDFTVVLKNVGAIVTDFSALAKSKLPVDIEIGFSKRLGKSPLRFSLAADELTRWSLNSYINPNDTSSNSLDNTQTTTSSAFGNRVENIFRHLKFGAEINLGDKDNFLLRIGYSYRTKQELTINNFNGRSFGGLSFGLGVRWGALHFDYGAALQHIAGSFQHIGITTQFGYSKKVDAPTTM